MRSSQNTPADIRGFLSIDEQMIGDDVYTILINKGGLGRPCWCCCASYKSLVRYSTSLPS